MAEQLRRLPPAGVSIARPPLHRQAAAWRGCPLVPSPLKEGALTACLPFNPSPSIVSPPPQVRKWHYVIPGFPWPDRESDPLYPTGAEVQAYLQRYARAAGLLPLTRFRVQASHPVCRAH